MVASTLPRVAEEGDAAEVAWAKVVPGVSVGRLFHWPVSSSAAAEPATVAVDSCGNPMVCSTAVGSALTGASLDDLELRALALGVWPGADGTRSWNFFPHLGQAGWYLPGLASRMLISREQFGQGTFKVHLRRADGNRRLQCAKRPANATGQREE